MGKEVCRDNPGDIIDGVELGDDARNGSSDNGLVECYQEHTEI